jgi:hypothetical protein
VAQQNEADKEADKEPSQTAEGRRGRRRKSSKPARNAQYWMIVSSPENFRKTRDHGFAAQGVKTRHRRRAETIRLGDRVLWYVTGRMAFAATATVTSSMYEDHSVMWRSLRRDEDYPWRFHIKPDVVLEEADWVPAKELAYRLDYVRKWPPEHWTLAFQGHLHQLAQKDFKLVEDELKRTRRARAAAGTTRSARDSARDSD